MHTAAPLVLLFLAGSVASAVFASPPPLTDAACSVDPDIFPPGGHRFEAAGDQAIQIHFRAPSSGPHGFRVAGSALAAPLSPTASSERALFATFLRDPSGHEDWWGASMLFPFGPSVSVGDMQVGPLILTEACLTHWLGGDWPFQEGENVLTLIGATESGSGRAVWLDAALEVLAVERFQTVPLVEKNLQCEAAARAGLEGRFSEVLLDCSRRLGSDFASSYHATYVATPLDDLHVAHWIDPQGQSVPLQQVCGIFGCAAEFAVSPPGVWTLEIPKFLTPTPKANEVGVFGAFAVLGTPA